MEQTLLYVGAAIVLFVVGIFVHAWFTRQKSNALRIDAIKAATDILLEAATSTSEDKIILAATERKQAQALAVAQSLQRLSALTQPKP